MSSSHPDKVQWYYYGYTVSRKFILYVPLRNGYYITQLDNTGCRGMVVECLISGQLSDGSYQCWIRHAVQI